MEALYKSLEKFSQFYAKCLQNSQIKEPWVPSQKMLKKSLMCKASEKLFPTGTNILPSSVSRRVYAERPCDIEIQIHNHK